MHHVKLLISAFISYVYVHGVVFPVVVWCSSRPPRWSKGRGRDISPLAQGLNTPPLSLGNHAPISFNVALAQLIVGILIELHIYMMSKIIMCLAMFFNRRNVKCLIDGGECSFRSTPQLNTIFTSYTFLMQMGSKPRCYIPLPLQQHCPQCSSKLNKMLPWHYLSALQI